MSDDTIDTVETLLASFICADASESWGNFSAYKRRELVSFVDAGVRLQFTPMHPDLAYVAQIGGAEREFALDSTLLLSPVQELLGKKAEIAMVDEVRGCIKWSGFRKITKRPRGIFVASAGADLYEFHFREIYPSGESTYAKSVAAISKNGRPVQVIIEGTRDTGRSPDGHMLVLAASLIEDTERRPGVFVATVRDSVGVTLPVPHGDHLEVFRLRDGPHVGARKRPLLHWVAKHMRKSSDTPTAVREHLRGVHRFTMDGLAVELRATERTA